MKIAAAVILYNPDSSVSTNIASYSDFVEKIFIYDNSETDHAFISPYRENAKFVLTADRKNEGIAKRLNYACFAAIESGFDWLLTMDQDSFFKTDEIRKYIECLSSYSESSKTAMFGVNHENQLQSEHCSLKEAIQLITSGSVVNLKLFKEVGGFNEELFIDQVDHEYCYRSILKGYKIIKAEAVHLQHSLGTTEQHRSLKTLKITNRSLHSPIRVYYMMRNAFYIRQRYKKYFPEEIKQMMSDLRIRIKNNLLYGNNRTGTLLMVLEGYKDFKKNKTGKY